MRCSGVLLAGVIACLALGVAACSQQSAVQTQGSAPVSARPTNVVIILADDMGWNDVGYHGSEIRTPNIDRLAREGITLDRFYAQPICTPTRAALMTGKSPMSMGVTYPFSHHQPKGLPLEERILPEYFSDAGYQTFILGKWHLGFRKSDYLPQERGFDHFYGNVSGGIGHYDHTHGGHYDWQRNGETAREEGHTTDLIVREARELITSRDTSRPMLLYAAFAAPHLPNQAPDDALTSYSEIENPNRRGHAAMVTHLDTAIGELIETLDQQGILEDTLILFMSDNGGLNFAGRPPAAKGFALTIEQMYGAPAPLPFLEFNRRNIFNGGADNAPFAGGKGNVREGGVRVPAVAYWKDGFTPQNLDAMITIQDILPTLLGATGIEAGGAVFDGANQWRALTGGDATPGRFIAKGQFDEALYHYPWKLITNLQSGATELYNLEDDPTETTDLSADFPDRVASMREELAAAPRSPSLSLHISDVVDEPDFFGGDETGPPMTDLIEYE